LQIREREPLFEPEPVLPADVKLAEGWVPRPELELPDFVLRDEVITLMNHLDRLVNTTIECLEIHAGIPRRVLFMLSVTGASASVGLKVTQL
jgi:hypothetical protein